MYRSNPLQGYLQPHIPYRFTYVYLTTRRVQGTFIDIYVMD